jgi:hypothetical protein
MFLFNDRNRSINNENFIFIECYFLFLIYTLLSLGCYKDNKRDGSIDGSNEYENGDADISYSRLDAEGDKDAAMAIIEASLDEGVVSVEENNGTDVKAADGGIGPERLAWKPPLEEKYASIWNTEPGYKNSEAPFCGVVDGRNVAQAIWSDERGVFVLLTQPPATLDGTSDGGFMLPQLFLNDGNGWKSVYTFLEAYSSASSLSGFLNGPLIVSTAFDAIDCSVRLINEQGLDYCTSGTPANVMSVFGVSESIAYAIGNDEYVYRYDNSDPALGWKPYGETLGERGSVFAESLWADSSTVVIGASGQQVFLYREGNPKPDILTGPLIGESAEVWAFSETDIWRYSREQLAHYDGFEWEIVWTSDESDLSNECFGQIGIWGSDGVLYFHNKHRFYRWNGTEVELLASWPCQGNFVAIYDIWGNSASEVFLNVTDHNIERKDSCGDKFILWFDGVTLRQI